MEASEPSRKRLFIGLITGTSLAVCAFLALLWVIPFVGLTNIHPAAPWVMGVALGAVILWVLWACLGLALSVAMGRSLLFSGRLRGVTAKVFLPLMTLFGRMLGISKERVRGSFIKVNNELVSADAGKYAPGQILVLLPHCLQNSHCTLRLTYDVNNCKRCGKCPVAGLLALAEHYGTHLAIATGGTIARRIVVQKRPRLILAVACERDLASGIQDTYPIPVYGVLNERPHGPCLDTTVSLCALEQALRYFLKDLPEGPPVADILPRLGKRSGRAGSGRSKRTEQPGQPEPSDPAAGSAADARPTPHSSDPPEGPAAS
ncbi:DUF116 domain-containing protein [Desulfolutivibrio sulfoxidireducens]|uniref:DUF116 domain-containing protein n=1 Tax=Desulfolutivibrio sulfoxidireducens TaxID=2773299 RepID=UPI00159E3E86|nr:DUF116 domain-containing protein [Desulfolutivibrio sulfoxidireducens]QLA17958.1 DUF116 domain-containing protein [Desulfolutivibrio sulfoxidireducens]